MLGASHQLGNFIRRVLLLLLAAIDLIVISHSTAQPCRPSMIFDRLPGREYISSFEAVPLLRHNSVPHACRCCDQEYLPFDQWNGSRTSWRGTFKITRLSFPCGKHSSGSADARQPPSSRRLQFRNPFRMGKVIQTLHRSTKGLSENRYEAYELFKIFRILWWP